MSQILISYESKVLSKTNRVKFLYALRGRDNKSGIIAHYGAEMIGKNTILAPESTKEELKTFFTSWKTPLVIYTVDIKEKEDVTL